MAYLSSKYLFLSSALASVLTLSPAFAQSKSDNNNHFLKSGNYSSIYYRGMQVCNQTVSHEGNHLIIEYSQPCSLYRTQLQCNSIGNCTGKEDNQQIYVKIIHNNHYHWENITLDYGASFLLNDDNTDVN